MSLENPNQNINSQKIEETIEKQETIESERRQPQFIKEFSKQESSEERTRLAQEIRQKRAENFATKKETNKKESEKEKELREKLADIQGLEKTIADLSENGVSRLMNYFELKNLRARLATENISYAEASKKEIIPPDMAAPKRMIEEFYKEQMKKYERREDIKEKFSEENLASLPLDSYIDLLKQFPSQMVAHVTRQGIRENYFAYHSKGLGEYSDNFLKIIKDGRLRSSLGIAIIEREKEKAIASFLKLDKFDSKEGALKYLEYFTRGEQHVHDPGGEYVDDMAIHFTTEMVADENYGAERGNEIFITFPAAHIASQYHFTGQLSKDSGDWNNDTWVWANEEKGMDINAGIFFIPESTKVDKKTGSKYELNENKKPIINQEYKDEITSFVETGSFDEMSSQVVEIYYQNPWKFKDMRAAMESGKIPKELESFISCLEASGIKDQRLKIALLDNLSGLVTRKRHQQEDEGRELNLEIDSVLMQSSLLYKEASDTISAKEYWENYFTQHPEQKPSKIVYYNGDPTAALEKWKDQKGLTKKTGSRGLGFKGMEFERSNIERSNPKATVGMDRFKTIAEKVIDDYFGSKKEDLK